MESTLFSGLNKRKARNFSIFLACSLFAWFLSNLSDSYESRTIFILNYKNLPDSLLLGNKANKTLEGKVRTSGFQLLYFNVFSKRMDIDISKVIYQDGQYLLTEDVLKKQMERQLSQNVSLLDLDGNQWPVDLYQVAQKVLPVKPQTEFKFEPNYILDGALEVSPDSILVKGPAREIDSINEVKPNPIVLKDISEDFSSETLLAFPKGLNNSIFSTNRVQIKGKVAKFSEKVFEVEVKTMNFPEGYTVKMFPNKVSLLCKATVERLKTLNAQSFEVVADYEQLGGATNNSLLLQLTKRPESIYGARLNQRTVNFVLERK